MFLRLPYGGGYMDNDEMARCIWAFLLAYFEFEDKVRERGCSLTAIDSMWDGLYRLTHADGSEVGHDDSLFGMGDSACLLAGLVTKPPSQGR